MYVNCVYPAMSKRSNQLLNFKNEKRRNKSCSNCFQVWPLSCQCLYCYCCVASFMPMPLLFLLCGLFHANAFIVTVVWPLSCQCLYCYCCVASFMPMPLLLLLCGLFHANAFIVTVVWPLSCQCLYCYCCVASFMPMPLLLLFIYYCLLYFNWVP